MIDARVARVGRMLVAKVRNGSSIFLRLVCYTYFVQECNTRMKRKKKKEKESIASHMLRGARAFLRL